MRARRVLLVTYPVLALLGLAGTAWLNARSGAVTGGYLRGWVANAAATSATVDLVVVFVAVSIFMVVEGRRAGLRWPWLYPLLAVPTALAFTLPMFLWARERHRGSDVVGRADR